MGDRVQGEGQELQDEELVSVIDVAQQLGMLKQSVFKVLKRLGIRPVKQRDPERRNALTSFVTIAAVKRVAAECASNTPDGAFADDAPSSSPDAGFFYVIQLEPDHDSGRFKVGFTLSVTERLRTHRCSAPYATVLRTWPCRRRWERAAIDCVSAGCEQLHTEVFRTESIEAVMACAERFFELMPAIDDSGDEEAEKEEDR